MQLISKSSECTQQLSTRKQSFKKALLVQSTKENQLRLGPQALVEGVGVEDGDMEYHMDPIWPFTIWEDLQAEREEEGVDVVCYL